MTKLSGYQKEVHQFLKLGKKFQELGLIDDMANKTFAVLCEEMTTEDQPQVSGVTRCKQQYPRHGARWEEKEKQALIALAETGKVDVKAFAKQYQRRKGSIVKYMAKLGFDENYIK